jgi:pimeloyl-ACP methyl ester carboxylesterase
MVEGLQVWDKGNAPLLVIALHGWGSNPAHMAGVAVATKSAFAETGVDVYVPRLSYASSFNSVRAENVVLKLLSDIDRIVEARPAYDRVIIVGFSLGALIARRLFMVAADNPPGFTRETPFGGHEGRPRAWARKVERLVTMGAFNRGWQVTGRTNWSYSFVFNLIGLIGHLFHDWRPTIFDMRVGAPFIVQTRLHWLAYRRWHQDIRRRQAGEAVPADVPPSATPDPLVVQLIGTKDDLASPLDQVDLAVDGRDGNRAEERRYLLIELPNTDHERALCFSGADGETRKRLFIAALTQPVGQLHNIARDPARYADDVPAIDPGVRDTVFIIHGIRDDGFWTHRIGEHVQRHIRARGGIRVRTPTYGYFAMLPFIAPWVRRQKVEWFADQYVSAIAQFPKTDVSYIGHSNGTYLAARAFKDYAAISFRHVFFAGSVVADDYDWLSLVNSGRVGKIHNVRASADWVVALLPKSIEWWKAMDLGGAGFDGFQDAGRHPNITQPESFANGCHSAAIVESQWPHIADFIVEGTIPPELPPAAFVPSRVPSLVRLANSHVGLIGLAVIFGLMVPSFVVWLTACSPAVMALSLVAYVLVLKFVITRV